jgi:hypothetical protein
MTHKELLRRIDTARHTQMGELVIRTNALRAVVEMHRPNSLGQCDDSVLLCWGCGEWGCETNCRCDCHSNYPCPTIQAIEKELK